MAQDDDAVVSGIYIGVFLYFVCSFFLSFLCEVKNVLKCFVHFFIPDAFL